MTTLTGYCFCGNLQLSFETGFAPADLPVRACQCSFCRAHGTVSVSDPNGRVTISVAEPAALRRYRFGLGITDFLICIRCGVYMAAVMESDAGVFASINTNVLTLPALRMRPQPVDYEDETIASRSGRRQQHWTPATVSDAGLE
jgi:hypothetical protein